MAVETSRSLFPRDLRASQPLSSPRHIAATVYLLSFRIRILLSPPPRSPLSPRAENARTFRTGPRSILVHRFCPSISLASLSRFAPASREGFHFFHINRKARRLLLFFLPAGPPPPLPRYNSRGSTERILNLENAPFVLYARARSPSSLPRSSSPLLVAGPPPRADICKRRSRAAKGYAGIEANSN